MSAHPHRCRCRGSGYIDGPAKTETVNGITHHYPTSIECTHPFWQDDTGWDPTQDEPLEREHPRAQAAFARGYAQGLADIHAIRGET